MSVQKEAFALLNQMQAQFEARDIEEADAFAIVVTTFESGPMMWVHGPVENYVDALRLAELHENDLNRGLLEGDEPYTAKVYPLNKPTWG